MKTDRFNEAVRRKLEGIEPPFQEQEWSKFQAFYKQQMPATWWVRTGAKWAGYGATGLVATILVVTNLIQYRENRILRQTVSELRKEIQVVKSVAARASVAPGNAPSATQSPLTASNGKTIPATVAHPEVTRPEQTSFTAGDRPDDGSFAQAEPQRRGSIRSGKEAYDRQGAVRPNPVAGENGTVVAETKEAGEGRSETRSGATRSDGFRTQTESDQTTAGHGERYAAASSGKKTHNTPGSPAVSRPGEIRSAGAEGRIGDRSVYTGATGAPAVDYSVAGVSYLKPHTGFEVYPEGIPVKTTIPVKRRFWSAPVAESPSIRLPKTSTTAFRAGGGFEWEKNYAAKSVSVGVILGKHWGLNTGLTLAKVNGESYVSERKFIDKNHRDFRMNHAPRVPPNFKIININTESNMVRIPVSVTYRTNLPDNWAFLTSAGTMLDVQVDQQYKFNVIRNPFTGEFSADKTTFQPKEPLINSFNAGIGLEKRFSHLAFQAEAYLSPSLRNCDYRLEKTPAGLRIRAFYEF